jgi:hypothetical protein
MIGAILMETCDDCHDTGIIVKQDAGGERYVEMCICKSHVYQDWLMRYGLK